MCRHIFEIALTEFAVRDYLLEGEPHVLLSGLILHKMRPTETGERASGNLFPCFF